MPRIAATILFLGVVLAACGGDESAQPSPGVTASQSETPSTAPTRPPDSIEAQEAEIDRSAREKGYLLPVWPEYLPEGIDSVISSSVSDATHAWLILSASDPSPGGVGLLELNEGLSAGVELPESFPGFEPIAVRDTQAVVALAEGASLSLFLVHGDRRFSITGYFDLEPDVSPGDAELAELVHVAESLIDAQQHAAD